MVFDLSCGCFWQEWKQSVGCLIDDSKKCLEAGALTPILPYHALHYPIDKTMIRRIAELYSKVCFEKAWNHLLSKATAEDQQSKNVMDTDQIKSWKVEKIARKVDEVSGASSSRLRIGYMSSDFVDHPTADLILRALLLHDKDRFDVYCYSITNHANSEYRRRLKHHIPNFKNLAKKDSDDKYGSLSSAYTEVLQVCRDHRSRWDPHPHQPQRAHCRRSQWDQFIASCSNPGGLLGISWNIWS